MELVSQFICCFLYFFLLSFFLSMSFIIRLSIRKFKVENRWKTFYDADSLNDDMALRIESKFGSLSLKNNTD
jgi:hypothetical protein